MEIVYIQRYDLKLNPHLTERFKFREASATRTINSKNMTRFAKTNRKRPA
nr:MAG TPA: hypothetical protein [Caudoviricetes sp.]